MNHAPDLENADVATEHIHAHLPYIAAVLAALTSGGIAVTEMTASPQRRHDALQVRSAEIILSPTVTAAIYGLHRVSLTWTEEHGWAFGYGLPEEEYLTGSHGLTRELVPTPAAVVTAVRAALSSPGTAGPAPLPRNHQDEDEMFERLLDAYAITSRSSGHREG